MKWLWLVFVVGTIVSWGCYVPTIHEGQAKLGRTSDGKPNPRAGGLRAFLCVGLAYFVTAVLIPGALLMTTTLESTSFNADGTKMATLAGVLGAAGALGIILAIKFDGKPLYIVPLVFAGAPIVSTFVTMAWHPPGSRPALLFYLGILMAAAGTGLVLYAKPT
jgi:hypothetical protein